MEIGLRLANLQKKIAAIRRRGNVHAFPAELRHEAIELCGLVGVRRVARDTGIANSVMYSWVGQGAKEKGNLIPMEITRIKVSSHAESREPVAALLSKGCAFQIFSHEIALRIAAEMYGRSEP